ncbi:hypothetical protein SPHV1_1450010 [Novosphingobium sp. KN65.2]|nr:hypothetical protein SPHV1_1450010 [Novosphingobium sp. KN65.2]
MSKRGRPPVTRKRVLTYIERARPKTVMQIVRATGADRRHVYRILAAAYGPNFRSEWGCGAKTAYDHAGVALVA